MVLQSQFWLRYGTSAAAAVIVFLLLLILRHYFADRTFMVISMPVVVYAAFAGGLGTAILTTALCICISLFFVGQELVTNPANLIDVASFGILGPVLGLIGERLLRESERSRYRQAHGGRIVASPNEEGGTMFEFTLPLADSEPPHER